VNNVSWAALQIKDLVIILVEVAVGFYMIYIINGRAALLSIIVFLVIISVNSIFAYFSTK
jgi:hypothetical protein